jgi:putative Ig domain-containing protein
MKKTALIIAFLAVSALSCLAYSCPTGYIPLGDTHYVDGQGVGSDKPTNICYQYPGTDYSWINFYWKTTAADQCFVSPGIGISNDQTFQAGMITGSPANASHECYVSVPKILAGTGLQFAFSSCDGTSCARTHNNTGSGGWSAAPFGTSRSVYNVTASGTLPSAPSGVPQFSSFIEGDPTPAPDHLTLAGVSTMLKTGSLPSLAAAFIQIDGTTCPGAPAGCTASGLTVQYACGNDMGVSAPSNDWNSRLWSSGPFSGQYRCDASPLGYNKNQIPIQIANTATGTHTIRVVTQPLDSSGGAMGSPTAAEYTFTITAVTPITYAAPGSYPSIPSLSTWVYQVAGTGNPSSDTPGYIYEANQFLSGQTATPGRYHNDSSSSTEWDVPTWGLAFYDVGRFAQQWADITANCSDPSAVVPCVSWSTGAKTQGQLLDNTSCFLIVITAGTSAGSAPTCPGSVGGTVTDGTAVEMNSGDADWWYELAQNMGDQFRNEKLLNQQWTVGQEWNLFSIGTEERYFRRTNSPPVDTLDANAVQFMLYPFKTGNGANKLQKLQFDGWMTYGSVRALPLDLIALDMQWRISGTKPVDAAGVDLIQRWSDILVGYVNRLKSCTVTGNITPGWPNCANNIMLAAQNFDAALAAEALEETCQVGEDLGSGCDTVVPVAERDLLDWMYSQQYKPNVDNFSLHSQPYAPFSIPFSTANYNADQSELNGMIAHAFSWLGAWCGNCTLPSSGTAVWTVGDDYFSHTFDNAFLAMKQYAQVYFGMSDFVHHRTDPASGGWDGKTSETKAANNPYDATFPDLLGPYPQGDFPAQPSFVSTGSGAGTWTWYSAPTASTFLRYAAQPSDPFSAGTLVTGAAGASCNANANICTNTVSVSGLTAGTYNVALGGIDAASNSAKSELNWNTGSCCYTMTITTTGGCQITFTGDLPDGTAGASYSHALGDTQSSCTLPITFSTTSCLGVGVCSGHDIAGLTMSSTGTYSGTPTTEGTAALTVKACDSAGSPVCKPMVYVITINPAATLTITTDSPLTSGTQGVLYTATLAATGGMTSYSWCIQESDGSCDNGSGVLPTGLTINVSTGVISGTPSVAGTFNFTAQVTDSSTPTQTATKPFALGISAPPPTLGVSVMPTTVTAIQGTIGTATVTTTIGGSFNSSVALALLGLPVGASATFTPQLIPAPGNGTSSLAIYAGQATVPGTYSLTVRASGSGLVATTALTLTVTQATQTIRVTTASLPVGQAGKLYPNVTLHAVGGTPGSTYTWAVSPSVPLRMWFAPKGMLGGIPLTPQIIPLTFTVADGHGHMGSKTLNLRVVKPVIGP